MSIPELEALLYSKSYRPSADKIQAAVEQNPDELLPYINELFLSRRQDITTITHMSWGNIARSNPHFMQADQERIYRASVAGAHPGVRRNALRYFSEIPVLLDDDHLLPKWVKRKDFVYCRSSKVPQQKPGPYYLEPALEGYLLDHLTEVIADPKEVAAPKAFGINLGVNLCLKYPEIINELDPIIREAMKYGTPGVKFRGKAALALFGQFQDS